MATLRTIKKADNTGRLDRAQVREVVTRVREAREQRERSAAHAEAHASLAIAGQDAAKMITGEQRTRLRKAG
jgi:tRNA(Arg) A34 adenosine deaminase TadA